MKVLVIDDESLVRRSLQRALQLRGDQVWTAADGLSGLNLWREHKPDLVFVDVLMPVMSGPALLSRVQELGLSKAKVVMMSAYGGPHEPQPPHGEVDLFIAKPFANIFETLAQVDKLIR